MVKYITEPENSSLEFVIAGYKDRMVYHEYNNSDDCLDAGKNLTEETAKSLFRFVTQKASKNKELLKDWYYTFRGIIPQNVLNYVTNRKQIVWWTRGHMQTMYFKTEANLKDGNYWVPDMLWILKSDSLSVFALKRKPTSENEKLYIPPFFNVSSNGSVCMGNAKFRSESSYYDDIIAKAEQGFWSSKFTHSSNNKMLDTNYTEYMKRIHNVEFGLSEVKEYKSLLIETKLTISDILK